MEGVGNPVIGRFAPSPTGLLHLGNLRTALASWLSARSQGGRWLIRIEDVDGPRCRRHLGEDQIKDLERLGLISDEEVLWQSDRGRIYEETLERLHQLGLLYPCLCTRRDLHLLASAPHAEDGLRPYPRTCRHRHLERIHPEALRFRLPDGPMAWVDLLLGPQADDPNRLTGDPLLHRRDGLFAYHLAVVVDDARQGVTEIVRGADLRDVTATQIRLQEALGFPRPAYAHLGLVTAPDGTRLGKRAGALGLEALVGRGIPPPEILGWLGWSLGCLPSDPHHRMRWRGDRPDPCSAVELIPQFAWERVPKGEVRVPTHWA